MLPCYQLCLFSDVKYKLLLYNILVVLNLLSHVSSCVSAISGQTLNTTFLKLGQSRALLQTLEERRKKKRNVARLTEGVTNYSPKHFNIEGHSRLFWTWFENYRKRKGAKRGYYVEKTKESSRTSSGLVFQGVTEQLVNCHGGNRVEVFVFQESVKLEKDHKQDGVSLGSSTPG